MLENSRLPLRKVLNALDISYKEYFKYFSVLFPLVYDNEIVITPEEWDATFNG